MRDSKTKGKRDKHTGCETEWDTEKGGISRKNIHMRERERKKEKTRPAFC